MRSLFCLLILFLTICVTATESETLDRLLQDNWQKHALSPVAAADDATFVRRVYLDVSGRLPTLQEARKFIADRNPDKRKKLISQLLDSPGYSDLMAMRYADMFRIKSEFPINLWPNAVQTYHRYFKEAAANNVPWNELVRELLTADGSNFRVPAANFFRASADRTPAGLAGAVGISLMGIRTAGMSPEDREAFSMFFSCIGFKSTDEWKEEIVFLKRQAKTVHARTPDGKTFTINVPEQDPRQVFADWLLAEDNPFFARAFVNRTWHWIFGKGLIDPADNMPLPDTSFNWFGIFGCGKKAPHRNEEILNYLARDFIRSGYDIKQLINVILNSKAYHAAWKTTGDQQQTAEELFAVYPPHRMGAEVLVDAYSMVLGAHESYSSVIPEPFTFLPRNTPAVQIADGSISSRSLDNFGRPSRDSGALDKRNNLVSASQRLFLLNSNWIYSRSRQLPWRIFQHRKLSHNDRLNEIYLTVLSRYPTRQEIKAIADYQKKLPAKKKHEVWPDLVWALINTREFMFHH